MSSPTINSPQMSFPSLEEIQNLIRALINDSQAGINSIPGEGQIWTDSPTISPFVLPMLNSSIREIYRELRNVGDPQLIFDNYVILGLPILDSPTNGPGGCDPTVQTTLSTVGYFDGVQLWPTFNCLAICFTLLSCGSVAQARMTTLSRCTKCRTDCRGSSRIKF